MVVSVAGDPIPRNFAAIINHDRVIERNVRARLDECAQVDNGTVLPKEYVKYVALTVGGSSGRHSCGIDSDTVTAVITPDRT